MKESRAMHRIGFPWDNKILVVIPRVGLVGYQTEPYRRNPDEVILNPLYLKPAHCLNPPPVFSKSVSSPL